MLADLLFQGTMVAVITLTISKGDIFTKIREFQGKNSFMWKLLHCPYCLSHWVAFFVTGAMNPPSLFLLSFAFVLVAISAPIMALIAFSMHKVSLYTGGGEENEE